MVICGACERTLPEGAFSVEQRRRRKSIRRCQECVTAGNQLVLMRKGRKRSEEDECPICNLLLPLEGSKGSFHACCMKRVCDGCVFAARKRDMFDCPFCRTPMPDDDSEVLPMIHKRVDAGDPVAIWNLGVNYRFGLCGSEKDLMKAVELWERAAELGSKAAHYSLGCLYNEGTEVEKDTAKSIRHWEAAAVRGHADARHNLGLHEARARNRTLALQHWMIAAKMGDQASLANLKRMFIQHWATKADYAEALRGYQSAIEEMRSPDRDEARRH